MAYSRGGLPFGLPTAERSYFGAPINTGVPVLDQDVNLMHRIIGDRTMDLYNCLFTCGFLTIPEPDPLVDYINLGVNTLDLVRQHVVCNGFPIIVDQTSQATNNLITLTSTTTPAPSVKGRPRPKKSTIRAFRAS